MLPSKQFLIVLSVGAGVGLLILLSTLLGVDTVVYSRDAVSMITGGDSGSISQESLSRSTSGSESGNEASSSGAGNMSSARSSVDGQMTAPQKQNLIQHYPEGSWSAKFIEYYNQTVDAPIADHRLLGEEEQKAALQGFLEQREIKSELIQFYHYTSKDVIKKVEPTDETRRQWGNALAQAFIDHAPDHNISTMAIYEAARDTSEIEVRDSLVDELRQTRDEYSSLQQTLVELAVPNDEAVDVQLDILNSLSLLEKRLGGMLLLSNDPIRAVVNAGAYQSHSQYLVKSYEQAEHYFDTYDVSFAQGEPGSTF